MTASKLKSAFVPVTDWRERYWGYVDKRGPDECWGWIGAVTQYDYGQFWRERKMIGSHRIAWELAGHKLPQWPMVLDHLCRNRRCCNPAHMRVVPQRVNGLENNDSPFAINKRKTHCKYGHPLSGDNIAMVKNRGQGGRVLLTRKCLRCYGPGGERRSKSGIPRAIR